MLFQGAQSGEQDRQYPYFHESYVLMGQDRNTFPFKKKQKKNIISGYDHEKRANEKLQGDIKNK